MCLQLSVQIAQFRRTIFSLFRRILLSNVAILPNSKGQPSLVVSLSAETPRSLPNAPVSLNSVSVNLNNFPVSLNDTDKRHLLVLSDCEGVPVQLLKANH